ncbi:MAG: OmpA family protein [Pseudomonadota bacterium]
MSDDDDIILSELDDEELVQQMFDDLYDGLREEIEESVQILLDRGWAPYRILTEALVSGMTIVGNDFRDGILFVPEVLLAANAMKGGMAILELDPIAALPTADECEAEIQSILAVSKISFEPGSATIDASALGTLDDIAEILKQCGSLRLEIQGHTDSQGREIMNLDLSQARAQSVLNELRVRRVLTSSFTAKGYGETVPIADNKTEEGREANRRIEFHLIRPEPSVIDTETTLESVATSGDIGAGDDAAGASDTEDAAVEEDVSGEQN